MLFLLIASGFSQSETKLQEYVEQKLESSFLKNSYWALHAEYVDSDKTLLSLNSQKSLAPASGLKLFTSAAALDYLGPDYQFETRIYYLGKLAQNGILDGNVYIRGAGDPTLGSDRVSGSQNLDDLVNSWVQAIKSAGIKKINGSVIANTSLFEETGVPWNWLWVDLGNYYGAGANALSINENLYYLYFKPGILPGQEAHVLRTEPELPELEFENQMLTGKKGSGDNGYIFRAPNSNVATLRGTIPAGVTEFSIKGSLPNPALFAAQYINRELQKAGIQVSKPSNMSRQSRKYDKMKLIHTTHSPVLRDIVFMLNKRSINLYAEQLTMAMAINQREPVNLANGLKQIKNFLKKENISTQALHLEDGSGLSPNNLISVKMMVDLLKAIHTKPYFSSFNNSMALVGDPGDEGYFKNFGKNTIIEKKCRIKSGLIQGVRSHSGYLTTASGRMVAFSFIANNITSPYRQVDVIHKELLIQLAETY